MLNLDMFILFALIAFILYYTTIRFCNSVRFNNIIIPQANSGVVISTVHDLPTVPELPSV